MASNSVGTVRGQEASVITGETAYEESYLISNSNENMGRVTTIVTGFGHEICQKQCQIKQRSLSLEGWTAGAEETRSVIQRFDVDDSAIVYLFPGGAAHSKRAFGGFYNQSKSTVSVAAANPQTFTVDYHIENDAIFHAYASTESGSLTRKAFTYPEPAEHLYLDSAHALFTGSTNIPSVALPSPINTAPNSSQHRRFDAWVRVYRPTAYLEPPSGAGTDNDIFALQVAFLQRTKAGTGNLIAAFDNANTPFHELDRKSLGDWKDYIDNGTGPDYSTIFIPNLIVGDEVHAVFRLYKTDTAYRAEVAITQPFTWLGLSEIYPKAL